MIYRNSTIGDIDKIIACDEQNFHSLEIFSKYLYIEIFNDSNYVCVACEEDGIIIGHAIGKIEEDTECFTKFTYGYIMIICVMENYRKRGIGKKLMEMLENKIKEKSQINYIYLHVRKSNNSAINLYQSIGYENHREVYNYYNSNPDNIENGLVMIKFI